ncbi:MATE family efflux transporter [Hathewaya massiliensis]|uniref:MATE family efflux transporter n=1 Tax=Hathewaya massiliensis TaxID=1964382 RepID=UPI00115BC8F1|nr:MATE family efflux transporter [Hathewaya massiliensis]
MGIDDRIFTDGKVEKVLLKFAIPAVITLLVLELYNMVDTFFVGRYVGPNAIGALTIAFPIQKLLVSTGLLIAVGTSTTVARYLGEENYVDLKKTIKSALSLGVISMIILPVVIFLFLDWILIKIGSTPNILPLAKEYVTIILLGGIFQCLTLIMCYIMTALGNTKIMLISTTIGAISNMIVDFILVKIFGIGVKGAAIATVGSQIVSFLVAYYAYRDVHSRFKLGFNFRFYGSIGTTILAVGFTTFIIEFSDAIVAILLNNMLADFGGDGAIVIIGVITRISMFLYITMLGISSAMQPIVAFNYGANNFKRLKETVKKTIRTASITCIMLWGTMMIFTRKIIGSFLTDPALLNEAVRAFRICISVFPIVSLYYIATYYYQSIGQANVSFVLSIYRQLVIFIPVSILFVKLWGLNGAWITYPVVDIIAAVTGYIYINKANRELHEEYEEYKESKEYKKNKKSESSGKILEA